MERNRLVIFAKDIQRITGRGAAYAQRELRKIKKKLGRAKHQFVTWREYADYKGLNPDDLQKYMT